MKKVTVSQVVEAYRTLGNINLNGVAIDEIRGFMRFKADSLPLVTNWDNLIKAVLENFKGKTVTQDELNKAINEALAEEIAREVEIPSFTFSPDSKAIILSQSNITNGDLDRVLGWVAPENKENNEDTTKKDKKKVKKE